LFKKFILYFLLTGICWSCAIHDKFPFICFRWSCITSELKLPDFNTSGMKKQRKARASLRKKKRQRAKNKRLSKKGNKASKPGYDYEDKDEPKTVKKDSLKYSFSSEVKEEYIVIRFTRKDKEKADSILVKYPENGNEISAYDKQLLKMYVDSNKVENIEQIKIREHTGSKEEDEHLGKHSSPVKRKLSEFFIELGIAQERIKLKK
jgi:hypothetical protein